MIVPPPPPELPPPEREGAGVEIPLSHEREGRRAGSRVLDLEGVVGEVMRPGRALGVLPSYAGRCEGEALGIKLAGFRIIRGALGEVVLMEPEDIEGRCE